MRKENRKVLAALAGMVASAVLAAAPAAQAETHELPAAGIDVIGSVRTVVASHADTLLDIGRAHGFGYEDMVRANPGVHPWVPGDGTVVTLPGRFVLPAVPREGIVLNIAEYRLYYFPPARAGETPVVMTYPVSIGRQDWATPIGTTRIVQKTVNPTWYPPQSVLDEHAADGRPLARVVPPGPDNPLGSRAMRLGLPGYLIHGTNRPAGVGMQVTHGCVRMYPEDIEALFELVPVETRVRIINEPVKIGWDGDELLIEVHPALATLPVASGDAPAPGTDETGKAVPADGDVAPADDATAPTEPPATAVVVEKDPLTYATEQFIAATSERQGELDWSLVEDAIGRADGMPVVVGQGIKNAATSAASE